MPAPQAHGPDISRYQQVLQPRPASWSLVSMKATEGRNYVDPTFAAKWAWAKGARYRGAYHWLRSDSPISAQAANLVRRINEVGGLQVGDFVQTDWETTTGIPHLTAKQVAEFNDRMNSAFGRECVITYSSDWVPNFAEWRKAHPRDPLWYANYNTSDKPTGGWAESARWDAAVWQWTSTYRHPAISGGFDMNHVFDFATLERLCGHTSVVLPPQPETPDQEDDMAATVIRVNDGDRAQFAVVGGMARWITSPAERQKLDFLGQTKPDSLLPINRADLKAFTLVGPAPEYGNLPGPRTTAADFGSVA